MPAAPSVLVTGSSRGLGLGLVTAYARRGWRVFATCRDPGAAPELAALAARPDADVRIVPLDLADDAQIDAAGRLLGDEALDLVFHNAAWGDGKARLEDVTSRTWDRALRVNAFAPLAVTRALLEPIARSARRTVVAISSVRGSLGENREGQRYVYRASKAALNMVVRSLAIDLAPRGLIVTAVHPGWVQTAMGGPDAPLSVAESAAAIAELVERLGPEHSGRFLDYLGRELPW